MSEEKFETNGTYGVFVNPNGNISIDVEYDGYIPLKAESIVHLLRHLAHDGQRLYITDAKIV